MRASLEQISKSVKLCKSCLIWWHNSTIVYQVMDKTIDDLNDELEQSRNGNVQ